MLGTDVSESKLSAGFCKVCGYIAGIVVSHGTLNLDAEASIVGSGSLEEGHGTRDRLTDGEIAAKFLAAVLAQPRIKVLLSDEH